MGTPRTRSLRALLAITGIAGATWTMLAACATFSTDTPADAGAVDTGVDTGAEAPADAGMDGPGSFDASGPFSCSNSVWICDNFDDPPDGWPMPPWDSVSEAPPYSTFMLTTTESISPPAAVSFSIVADASDVSTGFARSYEGSMTGFTCTFEAYIPAGTVGGDGPRVTASAAAGTIFAGGFSILSNEAIYSENNNDIPVDPFPTGEWIKVDWDVTFGKLTHLSFNGNTEIADAAALEAGTASSVILTIGVGHSSYSAEASSVLYDNVRCDPRP